MGSKKDIGAKFDRSSDGVGWSGVGLFLIVTFLLSWGLGAVIYFSDITIPSTAYSVLGAVYMLIPGVVAILLQKFVHKTSVKKSLAISFRLNRWFLVAIFTPIAVTFLAMGVSVLIPGVGFSVTAEGYFARLGTTLPESEIAGMRDQFASLSPGVFLLMSIGQAILAGCTINAFFALGEELGWRGYMIRRLTKFSFMKVSLLIGFVWGVWHLPLILKGHNYPEHPVAGVFMMILFCMLLSPMMTYIVLKSKSVITAAVFHGTMNAVAGIGGLYLVGGSDLSNGLMGYAGFIVLAVVTLLFYLYDKKVTKENIFGAPIEKWLD